MITTIGDIPIAAGAVGISTVGHVVDEYLLATRRTIRMLIAMHVDDAHRCERDKERERERDGDFVGFLEVFYILVRDGFPRRAVHVHVIEIF